MRVLQKDRDATSPPSRAEGAPVNEGGTLDAAWEGAHHGKASIARMRGRATVRMSSDEVIALTRGAR